MDQKHPEYLYHYTTVESLEKILQYHTIRFNSLINMDDLLETKTADFDHVGKYMYVSSWADDGDIENISLWGLYTNHYKGVRIKMKTDPFVHYQTEPMEYYDNQIIETCIPPLVLQREKLYYMAIIPFIRQIQYSSNQDDVIQSMIVSDFVKKLDGRVNLVAHNMKNLGSCKSIEWAPQKEYRYQFCVFPHDENGAVSLDLRYNHNGLPFEYWDVSLSEEGYNSIEITLGPKMEAEDINKTIALMERCFPGEGQKRIHDSKLKIR